MSLHQYSYTSDTPRASHKVANFILMLSVLITAVCLGISNWNWNLVNISWTVFSASLFPILFGINQFLFEKALWPKRHFRKLLAVLGIDLPPNFAGKYTLEYIYGTFREANGKPASSVGCMEIIHNYADISIIVIFPNPINGEPNVGRSGSNMATIVGTGVPDEYEIDYTYNYQSWEDWKSRTKVIHFHGTGKLLIGWDLTCSKWKIKEGRYYNQNGEIGVIKELESGQRLNSA